MKSKLSLKIIGGISIIGVVLLLFSFAVYNLNLRPIQKAPEAFEFEVVAGQTMNEVLDYLEQEEVIRSGFHAKVYAKLNGKTQIKQGNFSVDKFWGTRKIVDYLNSANPTSEVEVRLLEGSWAKHMALELSDKVGIPSNEFLTAWNDPAYVQTLIDEYEVLTPDILKNKRSVKVLLEGYLYPDTYRINKTGTVDQITRQILDNSEEKYLAIKDKIKKSKFTTHELYTFSSIVLYEASTEVDQQKVAGVYMNRLDIDMLLQASPTVCYALYDFDDWRDCELYVNQKVDSPYNTYLYKGLPAGPILNPTQSAILNSLNYQKHEYLFFVADVYNGGDGTVYYSKTFKEHQKKIDELRSK